MIGIILWQLKASCCLYPYYLMKFGYILLLGLLLLIDILTFTEIASLVRQPSDLSVAIGLGLLIVLIVANFFLIRYSINKLKS